MKILSIFLIFLTVFSFMPIFASDDSSGMFNGSGISDYVWNQIHNTEEYKSGNYAYFIFKDYSTFKIFFVEKSPTIKFYYQLHDKSFSKYGSINVKNSLSFTEESHLVIYFSGLNDNFRLEYDVTDTFFAFNFVDHNNSFVSETIYSDSSCTDIYSGATVQIPVPLIFRDNNSDGYTFTSEKIRTQSITSKFTDLVLQFSTNGTDWYTAGSRRNLGYSGDFQVYNWQYEILSNGTYYFRFHSPSLNKNSSVMTLTFESIISSSNTNDLIYDSKISVEMVGLNTFRFYTDWLTESEFERLEFWVSKGSANNFHKIETYETNVNGSELNYRYYVDYNESDIFYWFFKDKETGERTSVATIEVTDDFIETGNEEFQNDNPIIAFIKNLFVPSNELWQRYSDKDMQIDNTLKSKIPFVSFFTEEVNKAFDYVQSTDFLNITFPGIDLDFGIVHTETPEINFTAVRDAYEPYRVMIRSFLALLVYGAGGVYLVKYFLNYGSGQFFHKSVKEEAKS